MPLPPRETLSADRFYLVVLGPGTGESVLLRVPPDQWMVVDSFQCGTPSRAAALSVVEHFGGVVAAIALTHPHADHYAGIGDLIDASKTALLACVHPGDDGDDRATPNDPVAAMREGAKPTYVRIWDEWSKAPHRRWDTFRSTQRNIGAATITSLHPVRPISRSSWSGDLNSLSSAMLVEWKGVRLLLGADVPKSEWPDIARSFPGIGNHSVLKVPHHGSRNAIDESFGNGERSRLWIATPFEKQRLPRADDTGSDGAPEGLSRILTFVDQVALTALPFRHDREAERPCRTSRRQLRDQTHPVRQPQASLPESDAALERHVIVGFDPRGAVVQMIYGPGSVVVTE